MTWSAISAATAEPSVTTEPRSTMTMSKRVRMPARMRRAASALIASAYSPSDGGSSTRSPLLWTYRLSSI
jgi:hypothetical protein